MPRKFLRKGVPVTSGSRYEAEAEYESPNQAVLPQELWRNIVEEVASDSNSDSRRETLCNLSLTSRSLCAEAQRILYRNLLMHDGTPIVGKISRALHGGAAKHVRSLHVANYHGVPGRRGRSSETFFFSLPFDRMDNLHSLNIDSKQFLMNRDRALELCKFLNTSLKANSLTTFHSSMLLTPSLCYLFETQNKITDLSVTGIDEALGFSQLQNPQFLPVLKRVKVTFCSGTTLKELVRTRPIAVICSPPYLEDLEPCLACASHLVALDLSRVLMTGVDGLDSTQRIVSAAVNLRFLLSYRLIFYPDEIDLPNRVFSVFHTLANLQAFGIILEFRDPMPHVGDNATDQLPVNAIEDVVLPHHLQTLFVSNTRHNLSARVTITQLRQRTSNNGWEIHDKQGNLDPVEWFNSEILDI
ncbi:hypothetical protein SISNIDRAFT_487896 [Sistotremastrum niveocremeum HHB9708]|uniref:F-box domain-containing protein n=1 Tax=Sistotremastrum niveocremeum HHB9708 TaxID=1314777 RepID=A0A164RTS5_9AGAM|nr:hypothetical protein SISNIDRAFT_487896 [Sistotremastrum niveocremeum HHB9708]